MLENLVAKIVSASVRRSWAVVLALLVLTVAAGFYTAHHLRMDTDTTNMISPELSWRQENAHFNDLFPQNVGLLAIVIDGKTPDLAGEATSKLYDKLQARTDLFTSVRRADSGPFFDRYGMMYLPPDELQKIADSVIRAQGFIGSLRADPSIRGLMGVLDLALEGVAQKAAKIDDIEKPLSAVAGTLSATMSGDTTPLSWRSLMIDRKVDPNELRHIILTQPKRDFGALKSGEKATAYIRQSSQDLGLTVENGVTVRLTGPVALSDDEFGTVAEGMGWALIASTILVLVWLFLALRSFKLIAATFITLFIGLILTFAFAAVTVGSLNLISVAFAVMFIGLSIDFGIQFGVRFGQERFEADDDTALPRTGRVMARPLTLAAAAIAVGFLSFLPTDYRGVSELGLIAGGGMAITLILNLTLLPALLALFKPRGRALDMGVAWLAGADAFLLRYRWGVIAAWGAIAILGAVLSTQLRFDFNPLHLKDPNTESVSTIYDLMHDPLRSPYEIEILAPNLASAEALLPKLRALPEVYQAITASSFIPKDQDKKLAILDDLNMLVGPSLSPESVKAPPSLEEDRAAMHHTAAKLRETAESSDIAQQLARLLDQAADSDPSVYPQLRHALLSGLIPRLNSVAAALTATKLTVDTLPPEMRRDWIAPDGEVRIMVVPAGDSNNNRTMERFVAAVRTVAPDATGPAIQIYESGLAVSRAFQHATFWAMGAIMVLLLVVVRRPWDVFLVLCPLLLAGLTTIALLVIFNISINFANIISLPLLLGIGVAFNIYFVVNWRNGIEAPLQTSTARGVLFSALTTGSSFGSLAMSSHPGTSGMGLMLLLALGTVLVTIFFFLPSLLGPPPRRR
ncbi:MAG: hopanoid biosynthesis-associated RND transporter HpnN [Rhodospirillaceae bacterium]|nr:MAG: hopanoid biosynthesis-associated RND transporter HpnN [Rhodospirillaceae bacterium]